MSAALSDFPPPGGWTTDDLDALPEDGHRRELIDGILIMSPSPTMPHQSLAWRLAAALDEDCPDEYEVSQGVEVRVSRRRSFIPDVLVATVEASARRTAKLEPHEVVLAVEIVSDSTKAMDRITKPGLYAQAGIPFYWRIETSGGLVVHTHKIDPVDEVYTETGRWTKFVDTGEPWPINVSIERITPRHL
jgi:Uma2 family endonuclease